MTPNKICYLDLETGGVDIANSPLLQISGAIEIDWKIIEKFNFFLKPFPNDTDITPESVSKTGFDINEINDPDSKFKDPKQVYSEFYALLKKYVNPYDKLDKLFLCGYNVHGFDSPILRSFFTKNDDVYFGSFFWYPPIDVMLLCAEDMKTVRSDIKNFELRTVAEYYGVKIDETKLHDGLYDIQVTRELYFRYLWSINNKKK